MDPAKSAALAKHKRKTRTLRCAGCGHAEQWPTLITDQWHCCWCEIQDRCEKCGVCEKCFPDLPEGAVDPFAITLTGEGNVGSLTL